MAWSPTDDVAPQGGVVGHDDAVAHPAIVGHVGVGQEEVAPAHGGDAAAAGRAPVHGGKFPDGVVVADDQLGLFALEFQVLGHLPENRKLKDAAAAADGSEVPDHHVGADVGVGPDGDPALNDAERTDGDPVGQLRRRIHQGGGMDRGHPQSSPLPTAAITSPSTTRVSPTKARPCIFQNFWPDRRLSTSSRS